MSNEIITTNINGFLKISDFDSGNVILDKKNAVHQQNLALVISRALAKNTNGSVYKLCFGNGGTFIGSTGAVNYRPTNVFGSSDLYNQTYEILVDESLVSTPASNSVVALQAPSPSTSSLVVVNAVLGASEPVGQATADNITTNLESLFVFDEIGLKSQDDLLLTHIVFSPIEKTNQRSFLITYTLNITVA